MKLLEPLDINGMVLPNRIAVPAMVTRLSGRTVTSMTTSSTATAAMRRGRSD